MRLRVGARTDVGRARELNEDVYAVRAEQGLFVVCDGMGGCPAGEVASEMAAATIVNHVTATRPAGAAAARTGMCLPHTNALVEAVRRSNAFIYDHAQRHPDTARMGTTVVSAWIAERIASVAHVGDSRAYLWHHGRLEPLTRDHALPHEHQNVLLRALGREPHVDVAVKEVPLRPGDYLVLCSDGLTRMVPDRTLADTIGRLRDPQRICNHLVDAANSNGGADNITVVVVEVADSWWRRVTDRWSACRGGGHDGHTRPAM